MWNPREVDRSYFAHALAQFTDARLDHRLPLQSSLVFRVLAQVAELARTLDFLRQVDAQLALEFIEFRLQLLFDLECHSVFSPSPFGRGNLLLPSRLALIIQRVFDRLTHQLRSR